MKRNFVLNTAALSLLCIAQLSYAKQTPYMPDDFYGGWHPELAGQSTCLPYDKTSTHYTTQTTSGRTYSVGLNGISEIYGTIFGGNGSGFYEADGRKYFVGPYAGQYGTGPKGSETAYSYQICYVNAAPVVTPPVTTPEPPVTQPPITTPPVTTPPVVTQPETPPPTLIYPPVQTVTLNSPRAEKCSEGYTGRIQYKWEIYYTNDTYYTTYSDGTPATVTQSTPHQREVLDYNSCTLIPNQTTGNTSGVQEQTCDSYYNTPSGTYYGSVYKYGTYQSTYNSGSKSTGTTFNISSIDATSCKSQITSLTKEEKTETCPSGQTGSIKYYRFYGTNSVGQKVYPYDNTWLVENNNCADSNSSNPNLSNETDKPSGLLGNISITSSQLQSDTAFNNYLNALETAEWKSTETHKLILDIDDLSVGKYDSQKIGSIIRKYESVVGVNDSFVEIKIPNTADKFIGRGDITKKSLSDRTVIVKNVVLDGYTVRINYLKFKNGAISSPDEKSTSIEIIQ